jgi:chromosomal replication initiator protein
MYLALFAFLGLCMDVDAWNKIKEILRNQIEDSKMNLWINNLQARTEDDQLIISCPNMMIYQYVNKFYLKNIIEAYSSFSNGTVVLDVLNSNSGMEKKVVNKTVNNFVSGNVDTLPNSTPSGDHEVLKRSVIDRKQTRSDQIQSSPVDSSKIAKTASAPKRKSSNLINVFSRTKSVGKEGDLSKGKNFIKSKTFSNFVEGSSNCTAFTAAKKVAADPGDRQVNPLVLLGKSGLGKTHLLYAIGNEICQNTDYRVVYVNSSDFLQDFTQIFGSSGQQGKSEKLEELKNFYSSADVLLIDDIQFISKGEKTQEQFFYIIKNLFEDLKQIVVTCDTYPKEIEKLDNRIVSRLCEGVTMEIAIPTYEERIQIIASKAKEFGLKIPLEAQQFVARIVMSNVREIEGALKNIRNTYDYMKATSVTMDLVKEALAVQIQSREKLINVEDILRLVAQRSSTTVSQLKSNKRYQSVANPRNLAMYIVRTLTEKSHQEIGELFGGKNHSTVVAACKKIKKKLDANDPKVSADYHYIIDQLKI